MPPYWSLPPFSVLKKMPSLSGSRRALPCCSLQNDACAALRHDALELCHREGRLQIKAHHLEAFISVAAGLVGCSEHAIELLAGIFQREGRIVPCSLALIRSEGNHLRSAVIFLTELELRVDAAAALGRQALQPLLHIRTHCIPNGSLSPDTSSGSAKMRPPRYSLLSFRMTV